jgi:hypothetical protein
MNINIKIQHPTTNWQRWFNRLYGMGTHRDLGDHHRLDTPRLDQG